MNSPLTEEPIETFSAAKGFGTASECQHLGCNTTAIPRQQTTVLSSIELNVVLFALQPMFE